MISWVDDIGQIVKLDEYENWMSLDMFGFVLRRCFFYDWRFVLRYVLLAFYCLACCWLLWCIFVGMGGLLRGIFGCIGILFFLIMC